MNIEYVNVSFPCLWRFKNYPHLKVTKCKKIIDTKRGVLLKYTTRGFYIDGSYYKRSDLNKMLERIPNSLIRSLEQVC